MLKLSAKENVQKLAEENIWLAYENCKFFYNCDLEREELQCVALLGLVKASATFDEHKGFKFSTYASTVIRNEILMELRRNKKHKNAISLDAEVSGFKNGDLEGYTLLDMIPYEQKEYTFIENGGVIPTMLASVTNMERECITLTILEEKTQEETAGALGISQSYVSRCVKRGVEKMRKAYWSS